MHISYVGKTDPALHLFQNALTEIGHDFAIFDAALLGSPLQGSESQTALIDQLKRSDLLIAQNTGLLWAKLSGKPYLWLPDGEDATHYPFSKSWMASWLTGGGEALLLGPLYREAIAGAASALWISDTPGGATIESTPNPLHLVFKWHVTNGSPWFSAEYQNAFAAAFDAIVAPLDRFQIFLESKSQPARPLSSVPGAGFNSELAHLVSIGAASGQSSRSSRLFIQHDELVDAAISDANTALAAGDLAQVLTALESGFDLVGWEPRIVNALATILDFAEAHPTALRVLETALIFYPDDGEIQQTLHKLKEKKINAARVSFSSHPGGLRVLYVGNSSADYLAKCHEAFRTGMRAVLNMRMFGKGYEGYRPELKSFQEIVDYVYPDGGPDLVFADYSGSAHPMDFPYEGFGDLQVAKAITVSDFWEVTEKHLSEFVADLERFRISVIQWYFPQPVELLKELPVANIFIPASIDPTIFNDWGESKRYDVGFLAAGTVDYTDFYPERWLIHQALLRQQDYTYLWAAHPGWESTSESRPLVGKNFSKAINACRLFITTGGKYRNPQPKYMEILASRSVLLADEPHGAESIGLEDGVNYVKISTENFQDKIRYYLARPDLCEEIAQNGYLLAMRRHSCFARAVDFIEEINHPDVVQKVRRLRQN